VTNQGNIAQNALHLVDVVLEDAADDVVVRLHVTSRHPGAALLPALLHLPLARGRHVHDHTRQVKPASSPLNFTAVGAFRSYQSATRK